ncbi:MAG: hypothetical protein ACD_22C00014G0005 [uncultured bacterium]|nr:MAG: hypothetical protein ACD_22C00014G0005 [uncultured bacterium]
MIKYLLYLSILIWPFGLFLFFKIPQLNQNIYLLDLVVGSLAVLFLLSKKNRQELIKSDLFKPLALLSFSLVASFLLNLNGKTHQELLSTLFYSARFVCYPFLFFIAKKQDQKDLLSVSIFAVCLFFLFAILQYLFLPDLRFFKLLGFDDHYYRLAGTLLDPNFAGAIISVVAIATLYYSNFSLLLITLIALGLTFSRASYVSFISTAVALGVYTKKTKTLLLIGLLGIIIYLSPKPFGEGVNLLRTFSIFSRLSSWQTGLQLFLAKPIFGWGLQKIAIDNSFIYLLATTGLVGFTAFICLLKTIYVNIKPLNRLLLFVILVHSLFNNSLYFIWIYFFFWLILALEFKEYKSP